MFEVSNLIIFLRAGVRLVNMIEYDWTVKMNESLPDLTHT
jgi:hypothetical protein